MGGLGSGERVFRKNTVEESLDLAAQVIRRDGLLLPGYQGTLTWRNVVSKTVTGSVSYRIEGRSFGELAVRLMFYHGSGDSRREVEEVIPLNTVHLPNGASKLYFVCPLLRDGRVCGKRVAKVYSPPGSPWFGCRECSNLTYESCRQSDGRLSRMLRNPWDALGYMTGVREMPVGVAMRVLSRALNPSTRK